MSVLKRTGASTWSREEPFACTGVCSRWENRWLYHQLLIYFRSGTMGWRTKRHTVPRTVAKLGCFTLALCRTVLGNIRPGSDRSTYLALEIRTKKAGLGGGLRYRLLHSLDVVLFLKQVLCASNVSAGIYRFKSQKVKKPCAILRALQSCLSNRNLSTCCRVTAVRH